MLTLFMWGVVFTFSGFLLSYGCPINKKIWSPTFVLVSCGMGCSLLALLLWLVDMKGYRKGCLFFESFGVNPLFCYVTASALAILYVLLHSFLFKESLFVSVMFFMNRFCNLFLVTMEAHFCMQLDLYC